LKAKYPDEAFLKSEEKKETDAKDNVDVPMNVDGEENQPTVDVERESADAEATAATSTPDASPVLELKQLNGLLHYYQDALNFTGQIERAAPLIFTLLSSTTKSEIVTAMKFVVVAHRFDMECAQDGVLKMVHKIWDKDTTDAETGSIREHLVKNFYSIYMDLPIPSPESLIKYLFLI
jgi:condensin complex subunit 1